VICPGLFVMAAGGQDDELASPVGRVGPAFDVPNGGASD
jgi:hypothetical protein